MSATTTDADDGGGGRWDASDCAGTAGCPPRCPWFVDKRGRAMLVRPYRSSDWEPLVAMYVDYDPAFRSMGIPPVTPKLVESWLRTLLDRGRNFVAVDGGDVVGHATYTPRDDEEPELAVFVHQDHHDRGLGTELVKHVVADAAAADRRAIVLVVAPENARAVHVYRRLGFEEVPSESSELKMRLPLSHPVAAATQLPPARREAGATTGDVST